MRLTDSDKCAVHAGPSAVAEFVAKARRDGAVDLRGTRVTRSLLSRLTGDEPAVFHRFAADGAIFLNDVDFSGCRFDGEVTFDETTFRGGVRFDGAMFETPARFQRVRFTRRAMFTKTRFVDEGRFTGSRFASSTTFDEAVFGQSLWLERCVVGGNLSMMGASVDRLARFDATVVAGRSRFARAAFRGDASFEGCSFRSGADFGRCAFGGITLFTEAEFGAEASFGGAEFARELRATRARFRSELTTDEAQFTGSVWLDGLDCAGPARFDGCCFRGQCYLDASTFRGGLWFSRAEFAEATDLGPVDTGPVLTLSHAVVQRRMRLQVSTGRLVAVGARFAEGISISLDAGAMVFDGAVFAGPSTLAALTADVANPVGPGIHSLRRVDVSNLTIVDLDIAGCLFAAAHNLDKIKIEGVRAFSSSPASPAIRVRGHRIPVLPLWTRRRVLAEERSWRASAARRSPALVRRRWSTAVTAVPGWVTEQTGNAVEILSADRLASMYRALRKSFEDAKNEPGAADFYYGEMEMRRRAETTPLADRVILYLYWLISGYGLHAWRAFAGLLGVLLVHGVLFARYGLVADPGVEPNYVKGLLFTIDALVFTPDRNVALTTTGAVLRLTVRLLGPLLLGLGLLAVRNRVKR
ncbi:hypothetical protein Acsp01_71300 [Actinoplanes sp. NBRC 101535]|nr:hypothetical protein Acsp01_71300 [Actinoplanes sp. NBRC 101535]